MWSVDVLLGIEIGMILKIRFSACDNLVSSGLARAIVTPSPIT